MRWLVTGVALLGIACTTLVGTPAQASFNGLSKHYEPGDASCPDNLRNRARFKHVPDDVVAYDDCADSWGANAELLLENGSHQYCYNGKGVGTSRTCDYNFAENVLGWIMAYSTDNGAFKGSGTPAPLLT